MNEGIGQYAYVEHMQSEHQKLDGLIRRTLASVPTWEELDGADWLPRIKNSLVQIHTELVHHFREEEQGGCLEEAVARRPELSGDVQRIERQHDELLARLSELIDRCHCSLRLTPQHLRALEQELRQVVRELRAHEALENKVMQEGFGACSGQGPVEQRMDPAHATLPPAPAAQPTRMQQA